MNDCSISKLAETLDKNPGPVKDADNEETAPNFMDAFWECAGDAYNKQSGKSILEVAYDMAQQVDKAETKGEGVDLTNIELKDISITIGMRDNRSKN